MTRQSIEQSSEPSSVNDYPPASVFRRLMAILYDGLLLLALYFVAGWVAVLLNGKPVEPHSIAAWLLFGAMLVISFVYFGWFWVHGGQTLAMKTWRMRLVKETGINWQTAAVYFIAAILSWGLFGFGYLLALFHPQKKTLHDLIAGTTMQDVR